MPPDISEVLYAEEVVDSLVNPTASDYARALQGHRPEVIGAVALERGESGGGGDPAPGGTPQWTGPYTVTFEDIDPDNFAAVVMTPEASSYFLGGFVIVTETWTVTTVLNLGTGAIDDATLWDPDIPPTGFDPGIAGLTGGTLVNGVSGEGVVRFDTVTTNRVLLAVDDIPDAGSADIYLCFVTPEAP